MAQIVGNRYELIEQIGAGGMGTVYRGRDNQTNQPVAVKQLKAEVSSPEMIARFKREGEALRQLNHPNIVKILDSIEQFLVLEYVQGGDLGSLIKRERLPLNRVLAIALELADALARAHHLKIIHRDLKPANVLIADDGTPRLTDFGIARVTGAPITQSGVVLGTYAYLPPEAFGGGEALDARADLWAFGVMLFEMLAGRRPFEGDSASSIIDAILNQPNPDLEALRPDIPVALVDLVYRLLEKNRDQRIPSARQVGAELEAILNAAGAPIRPIRAVPSAVETNLPTFIVQTPTDQTPNNLPAQTTPFVGREDEQRELATLIGNPDVRLITILGPGGMGKTRLSLEAAAAQRVNFTKGVYFVTLAPLSDPAMIVPAIAGAVGFQFYPGGEPKQELLDFFREKAMLLVLDNFEHLLEGATLVSDILQAVPNVKIIVTSRERLNLGAETLFRLEGMDFPDWETPEDAASYSAVKLFLQSAQRVQPSYTIQAASLPYLARICRQVQGMPLGILLAATWVDSLSLKEISDEIARSHDILETDQRDLPLRQRSIRAVFDYSWNLLSADERAVFAKLSVFRGGFTREAAQEVAGASLRMLTALVNKSMLRRDQNTGRYEIHELLRQYAEENLDKVEQTEGTQRAHGNYFAGYMDERWIDLKGRQQVAALEAIETEFQNLHEAWFFLITHQNTTRLANFASALWYTMDTRGRYKEAEELLAQAIQLLQSEKHWVVGHLLALHGWTFGSLGFPDRGKVLAEAGVAILDNDDNTEALVMALSSVCFCGFTQGLIPIHLAERAVGLARQRSEHWGLMLAQYWLIAGIAAENAQAALILARECLSIAQRLGEIRGTAFASWILGHLNLSLSNYDESRVYLEQGLRSYEQVNMPWGVNQCLAMLGNISKQNNDFDGEIKYLRRGLTVLVYSGKSDRELLEAVLYFSEILMAQNKYEAALELVSVVTHYPRLMPNLVKWAEQCRAQAAKALDPTTFEAVWERSKAQSLDAAVVRLLDDSSSGGVGDTDAK